jgi:hypothetical protein
MQTLSLAQKRVFLSDILYVIEQAQAYSDFAVRGPTTKRELVVNNALLESSLGFLRKVNEFFGGSGEASIRVFIRDHPLEWLWSKPECDILNNQVMHLSLFHARTGTDYNWSDFLATHLPEALRRIGRFVEKLRVEQPELFEA